MPNPEGTVHRAAARHLLDFALGAATAAFAICCIVFLLLESARHGVSSSIFRYVGF